jgi:hypothetical protein
MAYFGRAAVFSKRVFATASLEPGSGTAAAARSVVGSLRGRCGTENYEPLSCLQVRIIGRFHQQQAKEPAKWLKLGPGLDEAFSRFILKKICYQK